MHTLHRENSVLSTQRSNIQPYPKRKASSWIKLPSGCASWEVWSETIGSRDEMYISGHFLMTIPQAGLHYTLRAWRLTKHLTLPSIQFLTLTMFSKVWFRNLQNKKFYLRLLIILVDLRSFSFRLLPLQSRTGRPYHRRGILPIDSRAFLPRRSWILRLFP